ncbi:uncharacterized protein LOC106865868 [Brachypodium distachyon]|uniref:uncharacterized protein LOC106865868 n=1 Tax=Brachypodium distachyon TaxID=15368 RepID=UPI00071D12D3|nr:uncharacterized protein LOC106865868 [Brachypodium distachyon]|eukprot:XP_014752699.1 uncharacterized protein LOC106865868 [Brachypodium distachyon]
MAFFASSMQENTQPPSPFCFPAPPPQSNEALRRCLVGRGGEDDVPGRSMSMEVTKSSSSGPAISARSSECWRKATCPPQIWRGGGEEGGGGDPPPRGNGGGASGCCGSALAATASAARLAGAGRHRHLLCGRAANINQQCVATGNSILKFMERKQKA